MNENVTDSSPQLPRVVLRDLGHKVFRTRSLSCLPPTDASSPSAQTSLRKDPFSGGKRTCSCRRTDLAKGPILDRTACEQLAYDMEQTVEKCVRYVMAPVLPGVASTCPAQRSPIVVPRNTTVLATAAKPICSQRQSASRNKHTVSWSKRETLLVNQCLFALLFLQTLATVLVGVLGTTKRAPLPNPAPINVDVARSEREQYLRQTWFSEFPGSRRPLSTTWPWSIKPSLIILWGVCWMFYGDQQPAVPQAILLSDPDFNSYVQWETPQPGQYAQYGQTLVTNVAGFVDRQEHRSPVFQSSRNELSPDQRHVNAGRSENAISAPHRQHAIRHSGIEQRANGAGNYHGGNVDNIALYNDQWMPAGSRPGGPRLTNPNWPEFQGTRSSLGHESSDLFALTSFSTSSPSSNPAHQRPNSRRNSQAYLPHQRSVRQITQSSRVTAPGTDDNAALLRLSHSSPSEAQIYQAATTSQPQHINFSQFYGSNRVPNARPFGMQTSTQTAESSIPSPAVSNKSDLITPYHDRRESHGSVPEEHNNTSAMSDEGSDSPEPQGGLRRGHTFKRTEDPPKNEQGKLICGEPECAHLTFDRKCEWSKHRDKHERPYSCSMCPKLPGFTYSGGLLRHEREVHKMHGGTKEPLMCPYQDCKRSTGAGFTRKENLHEHIRRVHRQAGDIDTPKRDGTAPTAPMMGAPIDEQLTQQAEEIIAQQRAPKRRRGADGEAQNKASETEEDLRTIIRVLQQDNALKDERINSIEGTLQTHEQTIRALVSELSALKQRPAMQQQMQQPVQPQLQ